jgi:hypothetical protein
MTTSSPVGIWTSCLAGRHPTAGHRSIRPVLSAIYGPASLAALLHFPLSRSRGRAALSRVGSSIAKSDKEKVMKLQRVLFTILTLIGMTFLFAGKSSAQQVKTDYDREANFGQYKTYSWEHVNTRDPLLVDRIKDSVNAALAAKGLTQVDSGGDVSIVAMEITRNQQTLNTFYDGLGGGWGWRRFGGGGFGEATTTTETYKVGTLVVDLFDTKTKKLLWRGMSSDTLSNNSDKNIKNLDKGVEKMFKQFPPGTSKK